MAMVDAEQRGRRFTHQLGSAQDGPVTTKHDGELDPRQRGAITQCERIPYSIDAKWMSLRSNHRGCSGSTESLAHFHCPCQRV
jgi:hypothetical protein